MKKFFTLLTIILFCSYSYATPSWMGNQSYIQSSSSQDVTFTVWQDDYYAGLQCEVYVSTDNGANWNTYQMSYSGSNAGNSVWEITQPLHSSATCLCYFHGYDSDGYSYLLNNSGNNYSFKVNPTTASDGNWSDGATWCDGTVPSSTTAMFVIAHDVAVNENVTVGSAVINSGKNLTVNSTKVLINNGSFTVSGEMTINGDFKSSSTVYQAGNITVNGNLHLWPGGSVSGSPVYSASSTLYYLASVTRGDEWTSATTGAGCPHNVQLGINITLNMGASAALCSGSLNIMPGATVNTPTNQFTIEGDLNLYGHINIGVGSRVTVNGTLHNTYGASGLVIKANASGFGSLIEHSGAAATVESYFSGSKWHFISAPVASAVSGLFFGKYLMEFNESSNTYTDIVSVTEPLTPGVGFALWGGSGFGVSYSGNLNHGTISCSLTRTTTGVNSGWNLVGNPYPSVIDWDAASGWTKDNLNGPIYIEDAGGWATYIKGSGTNTGTQYIAPGQGFFVNVEDVGNGTLGMDDNVRVHNTTSFYKSFEVNNFVRLQVSGNGYTDEAIVRFLPEATNGFDSQLDARKLFGYIDESAQIFTGSGDPIVINSLVPETNSIPLGIRALTSGTYTISASELVNVPVVTLEDLKTGIYTDLVAGPYTFNFESGEDEMRFMLYFGTTSVPETGTEVTNIYSLDQTVYVDLSKQEKGDVFIYNLAGQLVQYKPSASGLVNIGLNTTGIYVVKVVTGNTTLTKKVWVR